ncbi:WbqC family protein [Polaromonas sp. YR568]|uniref:WbqC family protein n=1 Tax=Polaromonas sp. YR568 TaxID=1855301 RepID=UPI003137E6D3
MNLAVMQPYFFPYLGYFHLLESVDRFVIFDDVSYINRGWINRNRIPIEGEVRYFTIPLRAASQNRKINEIDIVEDGKWKKKMLRTFQTVYAKSPFKTEGMALLERVIDSDSSKLVNYCVKSITEVAQYLELKAVIVPTSSIYNNSSLKAQERIVDICVKEKSLRYVNLIAGKNLYHSEKFEKIGCDLKFIKSNFPAYSSSSKIFTPGLSIMDIIMNCEKGEIKKMMHSYIVLDANDIGEL